MHSAGTTATLLDLASQFFGCECDDRLVQVVGKASSEKLSEFYHVFKAFAVESRSNAPDLERGELRPYLPTNFKRAEWLLGNLQLRPSAFDTFESRWQAVDKIKHRLLYCHSIALDHPLGDLLQDARASALYGEPVDQFRNRIRNFFRFLVDLRPLIERHVLCLANPGYYSNYAWRNATRSIGDELEDLIDQDSSLSPKIEEFIKGAPKDTAKKWKEMLKSGDGRLVQKALGHVACDRIDRAFAAWSDQPTKFSLYFPFHYDIRLLSALTFKKDGDYAFSEMRDRDVRLLNQFLDIELPGVRKLTPKQILSIRDGDKFVGWRNDLKDVLEKTSMMPADYLNREKEIQSEFETRMRAAQKAVQAEFKKSSALTQCQGSATKLVIGGVGVAVGFLINPVSSVIEIASRGGAKAAEVLVDGVLSRKKNLPPSKDVKDALLGHYVAVIN